MELLHSRQRVFKLTNILANVWLAAINCCNSLSKNHFRAGTNAGISIDSVLLALYVK